MEFCRRLTLEGWHHLQDAQALGKGVFVMSAHLGCWEAAAQTVALYGGSMDVVGRPMDNPYLDRDLTRLRTRFGNRVLDKRGAARGIIKALRRGGAVGILIDQRSPDYQDGVEVPFFGQPSRTSSVLARISLRTGAPVVPIFGYPEAGGTYRVVLRPPIPPPADSGAANGVQEASELDRVRRANGALHGLCGKRDPRPPGALDVAPQAVAKVCLNAVFRGRRSKQESLRGAQSGRERRSPPKGAGGDFPMGLPCNTARGIAALRG